MELDFTLEGGEVALRIRATSEEEEALLKSIGRKEGVYLRFPQTVILEMADEIRKAAAQA